MTVEGADVAQLRSAATQFSKGASALESSAKALHSLIGSATQWHGPDADRFRSQWSGQSTRTINAAVDALRQAANTLQRNADEQDKASAANAGSVVTTQAAHRSSGSSGPKNTADLLTHLHNEKRDKYGVSTETVVGPDGKTRLIVYLKGLGTAPDRNLADAYAAIHGQVDPQIEAQIKSALKSCPDGSNTDIMLVGFSEGGYDAQAIAAQSSHLGFHVTNVITYASAVTQSDQPGIDTVHVDANGDPMVIAGGLGNVVQPLSALGGFQNPLPTSKNVFSVNTGLPTGDIHNEGDYENIAHQFDQSQSFDAIKQSMGKFYGSVVDSQDAGAAK